MDVDSKKLSNVNCKKGTSNLLRDSHIISVVNFECNFLHGASKAHKIMKSAI